MALHSLLLRCLPSHGLSFLSCSPALVVNFHIAVHQGVAVGSLETTYPYEHSTAGLSLNFHVLGCLFRGALVGKCVVRTLHHSADAAALLYWRGGRRVHFCSLYLMIDGPFLPSGNGGQAVPRAVTFSYYLPLGTPRRCWIMVPALQAWCTCWSYSTLLSCDAICVPWPKAWGRPLIFAQ